VGVVLAVAAKRFVGGGVHPVSGGGESFGGGVLLLRLALLHGFGAVHRLTLGDRLELLGSRHVLELETGDGSTTAIRGVVTARALCGGVERGVNVAFNPVGQLHHEQRHAGLGVLGLDNLAGGVGFHAAHGGVALRFGLHLGLAIDPAHVVIGGELLGGEAAFSACHDRIMTGVIALDGLELGKFL